MNLFCDQDHVRHWDFSLAWTLFQKLFFSAPETRRRYTPEMLHKTTPTEPDSRRTEAPCTQSTDRERQMDVLSRQGQERQQLTSEICAITFIDTHATWNTDCFATIMEQAET